MDLSCENTSKLLTKEEVVWWNQRKDLLNVISDDKPKTLDEAVNHIISFKEWIVGSYSQEASWEDTEKFKDTTRKYEKNVDFQRLQ